GVHDVDRVRRAKALGEHVVDPGTLQHRPDRATGDDAGTGAGRLQQDHAGRRLTRDRVRDGRTDARHREEVLLGLLEALGDRRGHLLGLAVADPDVAVAVAHHDQRGEAEPTTTLDYLGDAVDRDDPLEMRGLLDRLAGAPAAFATAPAAAFPAALATTF